MAARVLQSEEVPRLVGLLVQHPEWRWLDGLLVRYPDGVVERLELGFGSLFQFMEGTPLPDLDDPLTNLYVVCWVTGLLGQTLSHDEVLAHLRRLEGSTARVVHLLRLAEGLGLLSQPPAEFL